ncbi:MAG: PSD1 and planctomycete cytochrome C domain-containing protein [Pirellulales bacterium]
MISTRAAFVLLTCALPGVAFGQDLSVDAVEFFERKIRPVLVEHCYECHSLDSEVVQGGLLLDSRAALLAGGDSGPAVVPREPQASLLLSAMSYDGLEMPPSGKLPESVLRDFEHWIASGGADPRDEPPAASHQPKASAIDFDRARQFWSFQKPRRHDPPAVHNTAWPQQKHDAFVLARLEAAGLAPNEPADRQTLIRRLFLSTLGLPPSIDEVEAFLADDSPQAWASLVDRVLASPHYGERVARMWLDLMRYAEDQAHIVGDDQSLTYPNAYRYRDWVITALNADMPYDEFVIRQLAADTYDPDNPDAHLALGFLGLGPKYYRRNAPEVMAEEWENHIDTVTRGLLGLTVACARCHDHKYDPIPTTDYYALAGVFASTELYNRVLPEFAETEEASDEEDAAGEPKDAKKQEKKKAKNNKAPIDSVHLVRDKSPRDIPVQIRGDAAKPGELVERAFLTVLSPDGPLRLNEGSGRRQLAEAIVNGKNPLAARVIVNRMWGMLMGRPLVATPSNFGALGDRPSHPELLDDLAVRFMDAGWSLKWLCREVLTSATWQQSSDIEGAKIAIDPTNALLWRMERRRLDVEAWRDSLLAASVRLDRTLGGPSFDPQAAESTRRTVYAKVSRLELNKMLALFDFPDPNVHAPTRSKTTTPLQKMFVLNSPFMVTQAAALAKRCREHADDTSERIRWAHQLLYGRPVTEEELLVALAFLGNDGERGEDRWEQYAQVLLASNEMMVVD